MLSKCLFFQAFRAPVSHACLAVRAGDGLKVPRVFSDRGAIHSPRDIGTAVTNEHAHAGLFNHTRHLIRHDAASTATRLFWTAFIPAAVYCTTDSEISMGPVAPPARYTPGTSVSSGSPRGSRCLKKPFSSSSSLKALAC